MHLETRLTNEAITRHTANGHWTNRVLGDFVAHHAERSPESIAIVDRSISLTYRDLCQRVDTVAASLLALGIRPREVASVQLPNCWEFTVLALALERINAVVNPIPTIMRQREVAAILAAARPTLLVVPSTYRGFDFQAMARALRKGCPSLKAVVVTGDPEVDSCLSWDQLSEASSSVAIDRSLFEFLAPDPNDVALLAFTSGTTDNPKGVMHTHNTLGAIVASTVRRQGLGPGTVSYMPLALAHANGYYWGVRMPLQVGGTQVYSDGWDVEEALETIERSQATFFAGTPACLVDVLNADFAQHELRSLSHFLCAGANLPRPVLESAIEKLPIRVIPGYGMTENGYTIVGDPTWPTDVLLARTGQPQPGMEVRVVDEHGADQPTGREGRLWLRGPQNFVGYSQGRRVSEQYFPEDDWFDTGDLAELYDDGSVRITGRMKDVVRRGAESIPVTDIEDLLIGHPAIQEVAIVGTPDDRLGERACACIVPVRGTVVTLADIQAFLSSRNVTKHYWPEQVHLQAALPKTDLGKVQKALLRSQLIESLSDSPAPHRTTELEH